jgi:hypothetical protein
MADKKISQLTAAATPLAGTEVLPIVQGGSTVKVSAANITAGRDVTMAGLTATGNVSLNGGIFEFNNSGADKDFRIYGDTDNQLFFTDASTDRIGIGTTSPVAKVDIRKNVEGGNFAALALENGAAGSGSPPNTVSLDFSSGGTAKGSITTAVYGDGYMDFATDNNTAKVRITAGGDLKVNNGNLVVGTAGKGLADSAGNLKLAVTTTSVDASSVLSGGLTNRKGTYTDGATTPSVAGVSYLIIANTSATSITNFTGAVEGQVLFLRFNDSNTTITRNNAYLAGSANFTSAQNAILVLIYEGAAWFEVCRSTTNG